MGAVARLIVTTDDADSLHYLRRGRFLIGRLGGCDLVIPHPDISRRHALVEVNEASACIEDQGSRNGTRIDGQAVTRGDLAHGSRIQLGSTTCVFEWLPAADPNAEQPTPACPTQSDSNRVLTPAQQKVLYHLLDGLSEKEVAAKLSVSKNTVHNHVGQIYLAYGVNSRAELLAHVLRRDPRP